VVLRDGPLQSLQGLGELQSGLVAGHGCGGYLPGRGDAVDLRHDRSLQQEATMAAVRLLWACGTFDLRAVRK
jgi:hypothetical protein